MHLEALDATWLLVTYHFHLKIPRLVQRTEPGVQDADAGE